MGGTKNNLKSFVSGVNNRPIKIIEDTGDYTFEEQDTEKYLLIGNANKIILDAGIFPVNSEIIFRNVYGGDLEFSFDNCNVFTISNGSQVSPMIIPDGYVVMLKNYEENGFLFSCISPFVSPTVQRSTATSGNEISPNTNNEVIFIHQAGATATFAYGFNTNRADKQKITIMSVGGITALTLYAFNGTDTVTNPITTLTAGGSATYMFLKSQSNWYKIS